MLFIPYLQVTINCLTLEIYYDYILKLEDEYEHDLDLKKSGVSLTDQSPEAKEEKKCVC